MRKYVLTIKVENIKHFFFCGQSFYITPDNNDSVVVKLIIFGNGRTTPMRPAGVLYK